MRGRCRRALVLTRCRPCAGLWGLVAAFLPPRADCWPTVAGMGWPDAPDRSIPFHDWKGEPVRDGGGKSLLAGFSNRVPFNAGAGFARSDAGKKWRGKIISLMERARISKPSPDGLAVRANSPKGKQMTAKQKKTAKAATPEAAEIEAWEKRVAERRAKWQGMTATEMFARLWHKCEELAEMMGQCHHRLLVEACKGGADTSLDQTARGLVALLDTIATHARHAAWQACRQDAPEVQP